MTQPDGGDMPMLQSGRAVGPWHWALDWDSHVFISDRQCILRRVRCLGNSSQSFIKAAQQPIKWAGLTSPFLLLVLSKKPLSYHAIAVAVKAGS